MLQHLIVAPAAGMCNRLRAIASARRLCRRLGVRCSIVWDWGNFHRYFAPLPDATVYHFGSSWLSHWMRRTAGLEAHNRAVDVTRKTLRIYTFYTFHGSDEPPIGLADLREYLPALNDRLATRVHDFANSHFGDVVGMHIRRTDHNPSRTSSPDSLFLGAATRLLDAGKRIFLATDNAETENLLRRHCGERLITFPKQNNLAQRWPRSRFNAQACEDDLLDLFLLARTEYVLGSFYSSFSAVAMLLNGSPHCRTLSVEPSPQAAA